MGWEHEADTIWKAQELYCADRLSFAAVAKQTGIAESTLKRWSEKYGWRAKREELAQVEAEIRVDTIKARGHILKKLLESENGKEASQMAFAVSSMESLALKQQELALAGKIPTALDPKERPVIGNRADAVGALRQAIENKIGFALVDPAKLNRDTVKDVLQCLALVDELEAGLPKDEKAETAKSERGLTQEMYDRLLAALSGEL